MRSMFGVRPPHHAAMVGAEVPDADVIAKDDEDVGFLLLRESGQCSQGQDDYEQPRNAEYAS
jgi:hypothetical protein